MSLPDLVQLPLPCFIEKQCRRCGLVQPLDQFRPHVRYRDRYFPWCRTCWRIYDRQYKASTYAQRAARPAVSPPHEKRCRRCGITKPANAFGLKRELPGRLRSWCRECEATVTGDKWRKRRLQNNEAKRKRRQDNPTAYREASQRYAAAHRVEIRARVAAWRQAHPEYGPAYRAMHRDEVKVREHKRRARQRKAPGTHTKADLDRLYADQSGGCYYCGIVLSKPIHVDHKTPLSRGGSNWPDNLALTCGPCNLHKHAKTEDEYRALLARQS